MDPDDVREDWAERSGKYSPTYYAEIGPNEVSETLADVLGHYVADDASILEIGCGSGRHLAHLLRNGYENLTGIDINADSFDVMAENYPRLAETGTFHTGAVEDFVGDVSDDAFDVVYTVETLQHIHPDDAWVFDEISRITADFLVTAENEGNSPQRGRNEADISYVNDDFPLFHRNWKGIFSERGFAQLIREPTSRDTIRVFRKL
ncbi:class I SAM-dependent methyltransferase [Halomicroarcula limicola]|uniref:Class I SAM-dependent methyltransferase n=1 Tax=Haloarcula limicola TaxID=1429915 RepID=A0A8J7Y7B4_9EURY|nr:class I SAM-dependent methyltransferase [Halomicroarcula limicola]MBV0926040.1 class I SAM-dependent methyltransferase [Halomicroarcula limicola]